MSVKVLLVIGREDSWEDRGATHDKGRATFDFRVEPDRTLSVLDISQGENAAREIARYQGEQWVRAVRGPERARLRRIENWD